VNEVNETEVSAELVQLIPLLMRKMHSSMRCHNENMVSAHYRLLTVLCKKPRTMSELAEMQAVSLATLSNTVAILVEKGWIRRVPSSEDRRIIRVEITELGKEKMVEIDVHLKTSLQKFLSVLSEDEMCQVGAGMGILHRLLSAEIQKNVLETPDCGHHERSVRGEPMEHIEHG
jgi:DNA-binding MarR family transcriptional regulator